MSDRLGKPSSRQPELLGYGSGGNRCTEACNAGIAWKLNLANVQGRFTYPEDVMFWFTEQRNGGRDVSVPRNGQEVVDWVNANGGKMWGIGATYADIVAMVNRGNVGMAGFGDYNKLTKANGQSPYSWHDPDGDGHVLMVVGYNTDVSPNTIFVHDSLLGDNAQPTEYSWAGFQNAQFNSLAEVQLSGGASVASNLSSFFTQNSDGSLTCKANGIQLFGAILQSFLAASDPIAEWGLPISGEVPLPNTAKGAVYREFELGDLWYDPGNLNDSRTLDANGCYRGHVHRDSGQSAADAQQIAALNKQIADLKAQLAAGPDPKVHQALVQVRTSLQSSVDLASVIDAALKEI